MFSRPDAAKAFAQVLAEVASGRFPAGETFLAIFRQAALCNLYFFLKYVASYSAAYSKLTRHLHADVCNARQEGLKEGTRLAIILPRGSYKSTIATHGANAWELVRNPDLRIGVFSFPQDRAVDFFKQTKVVFDRNELLWELFPETKPPEGNANRWNDREIVMPGRTMNFPEASLKWYTAGGATQGIHVDVANFDDLQGDSMLNADRGATADMVQMSHWFDDNQNTLLQSVERSRIIFCMTRYSPADAGELVMRNTSRRLGEWATLGERYDENPDGKWTTYYRSGRDLSGESIFPESYSTQFLDALQKTNPAGYQLNYANDPYLPDSVEFASYALGVADLEYSQEAEAYRVVFPNEGRSVSLASCSLVLGVDPAATEKFVSIRTSRTAIVLLAGCPDGKKVVLAVKVGYFKTSQWFDILFNYKRKYGDLLGGTYVELVAGFKSLVDIFAREQAEKGVYLGFRPINSLGDKDVTIRNILQPELERGSLYVTDAARKDVEAELRLFPSGAQKDVLDALKIAVKHVGKPASEEEEHAWEEESEAQVFGQGRCKATGY